MFPSNPYIPYKLKEIDLSYNSVPVLTYDVVFGTSKLEKLNLSHNSIADIRKGKNSIFYWKKVEYLMKNYLIMKYIWIRVSKCKFKMESTFDLNLEL